MIELNRNFIYIFTLQNVDRPNSWSHRKWVCRNLIHLVFEKNQDDTIQRKWEYVINNWAMDEINVCTSIAERYPKNYYAWTHRIFVIQTIITQIDTTPLYSPEKESTNANKSFHSRYDKEGTNGETMNVETIKWNILKLVQNEIHFIEKWLQSHISDHSAAHYGGQVMDIYLQLLSEINPNAKMVPNLVNLGEDICTNCNKLILSYPQKEVLWIWKRICGRFLIRIASHELSVLSTTDHIQKETYDQSTMALNELLQKHLFKDVITILQGHKESRITTSNDVDKNAYTIHSLTYIIWIMRQFKIYQGKDNSPTSPKSHSLQILNLIENYDIHELENRALRQLSINDNICYNTWRLSCATT